MRNKEQEFVWQKVIEACMENVKHHFDDIQQAIEFGCYIQPDNYFVSYIFATDAQLETARRKMQKHLTNISPNARNLPCTIQA